MRCDRNGLGAPAVLAVLGALALVTASGGAEDPERRHALDELAARQGDKPYDLLWRDGTLPSERTIFRDLVTGAELWRLTHDPAGDRHVYYDVPAWSRDGGRISLMPGAGLVDRYWIAEADGSTLRPVGESTGGDLDPEEISGEGFSGEVFWSWLEADRLYSLKRGVLHRHDLAAGDKVEVFDLEAATGLEGTSFRIQPPHPADDRMLFVTRDTGRIFRLDLDTLELVEFPGNDGRWATADGIHRLRWAKDPGHTFFIGQNQELVGGEPALSPVQYLADFAGRLDDCNLDGFDKRGGHPDLTVAGGWLTGSYDGAILRSDCLDPAGDRLFFDAPAFHHSSNTWDERWHVADNGPLKGNEPPPPIRGLDPIDSLVLASLDGRAQVVLAYHHASYGDDENTHPAPVSSPDGTKVIFDSDMLLRGDDTGPGNPDVWMAVVRPPSPPLDPSATVLADGAVEISWRRPEHAEREIYWNPGNESREVAGYLVSRGESSGGPYEPLHAEPVGETTYTDSTAEPGVDHWYVVQSVEPSGLASLYSAEAFAATDGAPWSGAVRAYRQAEHGRIALPMVLQADFASAAGGWYAGTFAAEPDPSFPLEPYPAKLWWTIEVPVDGAYTTWARLRSWDVAGSVEASVDGVPVGTLPAPVGAWEWVAAAPADLVAGDHRFELRGYQPGVGIDQILVTDEPAFVPPALGAADVTPPPAPPVGDLVQVDATTRKVLWTPPDDPDVRHYQVYCGRDASLPLDNTTTLLSPSRPEILDWGIPEGRETVYAVTAVDRFGNESAPLVLGPEPTGWAPVTTDDLWTLAEDEPLEVAGPGVLANDSDDDGDPLTAELYSLPDHGTLELAADGGFLYTPDLEFSGTDRFTYRANDGKASSYPAEVVLEVTEVDDPPVALPDAYSGEEDHRIDVARKDGVLANDSDAEGATLTAALATQAVHGTVELAADGAFVYTPDADFAGEDSFTYVASDGGLESPPATVTLTVAAVQDPPSPVDDAYAVAEDGVLGVDAASGVLANDSDPDGDPLAALPDAAPASGSVELAADGSFVYTPDPDFHGVDTFGYLADDGTEVAAAEVKVTVTAVNDPPQAAPDAYAVAEDDQLLVDAVAGVLANDTDVDGDGLAAVLVSDVAHGSLTLGGAGTINYRPDADFSGSDSFTYLASDGAADSEPVSVELTVEAVNDPPVAVPDGYETAEDTPLAVTVDGGVLANDTDADGDALRAALLAGPSNGTLALARDGSFVYTPDPDFHGDDFFGYRAGDGKAGSPGARVTVTVTPVNDPPVAAPDAYEGLIDVLLSIPKATGVLANDSDPDGDSLTAILVRDVEHGTLALGGKGAIDYRPDPGFLGTDTFTYRASDGQAESAEVEVELTIVPSLP